jgi:circadian clock protein KaiB
MRTSSSGQEFGQAEAEPLVLRLFVAGNNPRSHNTIVRMRQFCEQYLEGRYQLDIIDIYQQRSLARSAQIIATPTLVKYFPLPKKVWVGDLSNTERILAGLDLPPAGPNPTDPS